MPATDPDEAETPRVYRFIFIQRRGVSRDFGGPPGRKYLSSTPHKPSIVNPFLQHPLAIPNPHLTLPTQWHTVLFPTKHFLFGVNNINYTIPKVLWRSLGRVIEFLVHADQKI